MFFPSYLVAGSFKSKLIRKRVLRNHAGFLGYQFFVFLISIISDYIIWFSICCSPSPFYFTGHDLTGDHNSCFLSDFVMQFQYNILKSNEHSYSLSTVPKVARTCSSTSKYFYYFTFRDNFLIAGKDYLRSRNLLPYFLFVLGSGVSE